jgi:hypothetical protein
MSPVPTYAFDAFVDESYDDTTVFTVAGFLAPEKRGPAFGRHGNAF